jgi:hypothetical protein
MEKMLRSNSKDGAQYVTLLKTLTRNSKDGAQYVTLLKMLTSNSKDGAQYVTLLKMYAPGKLKSPLKSLLCVSSRLPACLVEFNREASTR